MGRWEPRGTVDGMRIAIVVPGGVGADGVHAVVPALLSLVERLAVRHDVLVVATNQVAEPAAHQLRGARVVCLGALRRSPVGRFRAAWRGVTTIHLFRADVIHALWLGPSSTLAVAAGALLRVPVVASIGGGELVALPRIHYGGALTRRGRWHATLAIRRAAVMTAGSRAALEPLLPRRPDARWLPLGAEPQPAEAATLEAPAAGRAEPPAEAPDRPTRLLVVASVNRVKGPDVILEAFARTRAELGDAIELEWIGEDTLRGGAQALARAIGVAGAVTFSGFRPHAEVLAAWSRTDLAIQGSWHESQGVAVLEAAMAGVPTIGTAVGLVAELANRQPPAAIAVPPGDAAALGSAVVDAATDPELLRALGATARAWARAHDADWTAAAFEAIYAEVVTGR